MTEVASKETTSSAAALDEKKVLELVLPSQDAKQWAYVKEVLAMPVKHLHDLDVIITKFSALDRDPHVCTFFEKVPGSEEAGKFDWDLFLAKGVPFIIEVALDMPKLFANVRLPIFQMRSSWAQPKVLHKETFSLTRRQCACLLAHSFFGSLKRPAAVQPNDFRFTAVDLFNGTAASPNSAVTFLNYFSMLGRHGIPDGILTFERQGYRKGRSPWQFKDNEKPLCKVAIVDGNIDDCVADLHAEFANAFVGGGVMSGDAAMEETLFLVKPELMVAMALHCRMVDTEVVCVSGARKFSLTSGFGQSFRFAGDYDGRRTGPPPKVCAIDAVRGGGPALKKKSLLRDMNKARIAFDGAEQLATGHWGCGAYGNNNDLMFVKQWLAASEAGVTKMFYHDYSKDHSHLIFPMVRKLGHLTVGQLWAFLLHITRDLSTAAAFTGRMRELAVGKIAVPFAPTRKTKSTKKNKQKNKLKSSESEAEMVSKAVATAKAEAGAEGKEGAGTGVTKAVPKSDPECVSSAGPKIAACGTTNAGKHEACRRCFANWPGIEFTVRGISTNSGVSEQPMGLEETVLGAKNRAIRARAEVHGAAIGVGLESGLVVVDGKYFDFCACSIFDGKRHCVGMSSMFPLPPKVVELLPEKGYNEAFRVAGVEPDATGDGVLGAMSGGILSRPAQMKESVDNALLQLKNPGLYKT